MEEKNTKLKKVLMILLSISVIILVASIIFYFYYPNLDGSKIKEPLNYSHIIANKTQTNQNNQSTYQILYILTFNKEEICINCKVGYMNLEPQERKAIVESFENTKFAPTDIRVEDKNLFYSYELFNDMTKQETNHYLNENNFETFEI